MQNLLKIPLHRLVAGRPVSGDIYLDMPRNGKRLKILNAGESFDETSLIKFRENETAFLLIAPQTPGEYEPETLPLFLDEIPAQVTAAPSTNQNENLTTAPENAVPMENSSFANTPETEETKLVTGSKDTPIEDAQRFVTESLTEEENRITAKLKDTSVSKITVTGAEHAEEELFVVQGGGASSDLEKQKVQSLANLGEVPVISDEKVAELQRERKQQQIRNTMARLEGDDLAPPLEDEIIEVEEYASPTEEFELGSDKDSSGDRNTGVLKEQLRVRLESIEQSTRAIEIKNQQNAQKLRNALENIEAGLPPAPEDLAALAMEDQASGIDPRELKPESLKRKIEQKLEELENEVNVRAEELGGQRNAQRIRNALANLEAGLPPEEDWDELLLANEDDSAPPEVINSDALLELAALEPHESEERVLNLLKERTNAPRDVRSVISSLAVQLAQSIGYTNPQFLSDLALTVLLHFAKREGKEIKDETQIPELTRFLDESQNSSEIAAVDTKQILFLLEKYILDPDCDKRRKDLSPPLLLKLEKVLEQDASIDPENMARWQLFAKRGTTLDMMTVAAQASTNALKLARNLI